MTAVEVSILSLGFMIFSAIIGASIKITLKVGGFNTALVALNNTFVASLQLAENRIFERHERDTREIEQQINRANAELSAYKLTADAMLAAHKLYCEQTYISKNSFNIMSERNSAERREMKLDIMGAVNEVKQQLTNLQKQVSELDKS